MSVVASGNDRRLQATSRYSGVERAATQMLLSEDFLPSLASEPTDAQPGSAKKVEVLARRAMAGESLWHPMDAGWYQVDNED
jgi:hypothetical protein